MNAPRSNALASMWAVMRKELLDISRDRRTLALMLLMTPLLTPLLILGMSTLAEKRIRTQMDQTLEVPVLGAERAPNLVAFLASRGIEVVAPPDDLDAAIARQDVDVALEIAPDFTEAWHAGRAAGIDVVSDSTQRNAEVPAARVRSALEAYGQQVGALRLVARGIDPGVARPLGVGNRDLASEAARQGMALSFFLPYLLILSGFLGGVYLIVDATGGERERQSLEPLLATPAARGAIVSGKMAAGCAIGLVALLLTLLALKGSSHLGDTARMLDLRWLAIGKLLVILLPMVVIGTALFTFLAAAAKSVKEAQTHMSWLMLLPMIPTFVLMVNPIKTELWQFTVPFLSQNQMILKVVRAEPIPADIWGIYLGAALALAGLLWLAAVRRYGQERLAVAG
ncbi:ABC transporter permease [Luteimonas yindakuii]|uniref:ABC transporter permease n=1 Tax=Luteimonas yindakuii TaxID=2565782 RepID=UPI001FCA40A0|nr:ABC transporter permease subunit [Luteimonas yindakuii]